MERGSNFRAGRGGRGYGRERGRGGRGGRGRGRGGGGGRRDSFGGQHRPRESQGYKGYTAGYTPSLHPYPPPPPPPPPQYGDYQNEAAMYPSQQIGYAPPPPQQQGYPGVYPEQPPQHYQHYQNPYYQSQYQQPQGYAENSRKGYMNSNPPPFQPQPVYQQQPQPPPPQYPQLPLPQQQSFQSYREANSRYPTNPPLPPMSAPEYSDVARARQQAYAPLPPDDKVSEPPPPSYHQQQPPLPPMPQDARGDWNVPAQPRSDWPPPPPPPPPAQYMQPQMMNGRFPGARQNRNPLKPHRPPPVSYICHNCNQPGHWIQDCPLFANQQKGTVYPSFPSTMKPPQDPRRNSVPYTNPAPPFPNQKQWTCEPCGKTFYNASQYESHLKTHVQCDACDFTASLRVVNTHFESSHGQYAGDGMKEIEVEGKKFMVLVGNSAEDIAKWRAERRKKYFAMARPPQAAKKRPRSLSSEEDLEEGEIEEDEEAKAQMSLNAAPVETTATTATTANVQESSAKKPRKKRLCRLFLRGRCRSDGCKFRHDRSTVGCRAMISKGSCSKGVHCAFSHDTAVVSGQRNRAQKIAKERVLEQQWRGERKSLLRRLLAKDVRAEQQKMLQIVHFLVKNEVPEKPVATKEESNDEDGQVEAGESITVLSEDVVMDEASECREPCEQTNSTEASACVLPVVGTSACEVKVADIEEMHVRETKGEEEERGENCGRSSVQAEIVNPEEVAVAGPWKEEVMAEDKEGNPAYEAHLNDQIDETSK